MPQSDKVKVTTNVETRDAAKVRAADLPGGSVVALPWIVWIKGHFAWHVTGGGAELDYNRPDSDVDNALANGAQVLRVGTGREG